MSQDKHLLKLPQKQERLIPVTKIQLYLAYTLNNIVTFYKKLSQNTACMTINI